MPLVSPDVSSALQHLARRKAYAAPRVRSREWIVEALLRGENVVVVLPRLSVAALATSATARAG